MRVCSVDVGTTGAKVIVFDEDGRELSAAFREYPVVCEREGWAEQDSERVFDTVLDLMEQCIAGGKIPEIDAVTLSVQGDAVIPVGERGQALLPAILGMDNRSIPQAEFCAGRFGAYQLFEKTGMRPHAINSAVKIMWIQEERPDIAEKTVKYLTYDSFLLKRLGSDEYVTDLTMASRSMMCERGEVRWSEPVLKDLNIALEKLPAIVTSGEGVGRLRRDIAERMKLKNAPYLIAGGHDQTCAGVGAGAVVPGVAVDSHGTAEVLSAGFTAMEDQREMFQSYYPCYRHAVPELYFTFALNHCGGIVFRWFRDTFAREEIKQARSAGRSGYDLIADRMSSGPSDLLFLPHFNGSGTPYCDYSARGTVLGLTLSAEKYDIARALLEGLAMELRLNMEQFEKIGIAAGEIRCVGGGASHPKVLQIKADVLNRPVSVMENREAASLGAAVIAFAGMGYFKTIQDGVKKMVKVRETYEPRLRLLRCTEKSLICTAVSIRLCALSIRSGSDMPKEWKKEILIGVDIGTSGTKAAVTDSSGRVLGTALEGYPLICKESGWAEQDANDWERAVYKTVARAVEAARVEAGEVAGICISGLFAGSGVPVDDSGNPVRNAIIWMDRRAVEQSERTRKIVPDNELFDITGNRNDAYFGFNKILWIKENEPELWSRIRWFLPSNSYLVYKLTGVLTIDYTSAANIGGIYDMKKHDWAYGLMERMGIPDRMFPKNWKAPDEIAGYLRKEAAERMGLIPGIPVCAGCTDCLASVISAGVTKEHVKTAVIGTSINWGILHRSVPSNPELVTMPNAVSPLSFYYTYGGITSAGALCGWFLDNLAPYSRRDGKTVKTDFSMLEEEASEIPAGSEGLLVLPYFMGERSPVWDSEARGVFCGLSVRHTRAHMYRAILESTAFAVRHIQEKSDLFEGGSCSCIVSGGACRSKLWMQILADVTGICMITTSGSMQAPVGDALIAGVAAGVVSSYEEAEKWCRYEERIEPDPKLYGTYEMYYREYKKLYEATADIVHALSGM
ncbi:FGGY family carbohydrate kinase [Clostridium sp. AM58-1XD]|uniref:FGGY family carbohydrate kinase n=1 Tax=Clostridium sp. AM58-1XD TaxID=2292307 RepID=UPI000E55678E|nr:FGGY family carbohydrate kinase [Clostridium sp. AM58-1XD]RGZ01572.1 hypothetical protein DXA13_01705 [Clostridium sp. AM58-1XD]